MIRIDEDIAAAACTYLGGLVETAERDGVVPSAAKAFVEVVQLELMYNYCSRHRDEAYIEMLKSNCNESKVEIYNVFKNKCHELRSRIDEKNRIAKRNKLGFL